MFKSVSIPNLSQHSQTRVTALMAAAGQGHLAAIEQLLSLGADIGLKANNGWTAKDFAIHTAKMPAVEILESYQ